MKAVTLLGLGAAALGAALLPGPAAAAAPGAGARGLEPLTCRALEVSLKTSVYKNKGTYAGKTVTLTGKVKNTGSQPLEGVAVGFHLPGAGTLCRTKAALYPNPRTQEVQFQTDGGANVYWEGFTLGAGKWRKFELKAEVAAGLAAGGGELEVAAVGYVMDDGACTTITEPEKIEVHPLGPGKTTTNSASAVCAFDPGMPAMIGAGPGPGAAGASLTVAAENQHCAEGGEIAVSDERRQALSGVRKLPTVVTQETCWAQCSEDGFKPPFFMSVERSPEGKQCFCSHSCRPVYRRGVKVHQVNRHASAPFGEKAARRR